MSKRTIDVNDRVGQRIGNLQVIKFDHEEVRRYNGKNKILYLYSCLCDCGNTTIVERARLSQAASKKNQTRSCGCLMKLNGPVSQKQNSIDGVAKSNNKQTGISGVYMIKEAGCFMGKYTVEMTINNYKLRFGLFDNLAAAVRVRQKAEDKRYISEATVMDWFDNEFKNKFKGKNFFIKGRRK